MAEGGNREAAAAGALAGVLAGAGREARGRLLSILIARLGNFDLAEEALSEAMLSALTHWARSGVPASPEGWLLKVAHRKAIDRIRREGAGARRAQSLAVMTADKAGEEAPEIPDERLRLIFTCCHPALEEKSRVALTLRTVCGLSTRDIAAVFLDAEAAMGQRLSRAKAKIAAAGIAFAVPEKDAWPLRLQSVLAVIYLVFTAGYAAGPGPGAGAGLAGEAIFLARLLNDLRGQEAEIEGCLALLLLTHARQAARTGPEGESVPVADQDRSLWDYAAIAEGRALLGDAMARRAPGPFQIKAAIAACHLADGGPDWPQIAMLYGGLVRLEPTPVVRLNRAVALAEAGALQPALAEIARLGSLLDGYQPYHAAAAELYSRAGDTVKAQAAYERAINMAQSEASRRFLLRRRQWLGR